MARIVEKINACRDLVGKPEIESGHLQDLGADVRVILKLILNK